jgi:threonine/homoserine efflux transporter RhtA
MMKVFSTAGRTRMKVLLGTLILFVVLDGLLTELLINRGAAREINPFLQPLVGDIGFMLLKVVGALLCALILWDIYRRFPKLASIATWIAVVGYGVIVVWNASLFIMA